MFVRGCVYCGAMDREQTNPEQSQDVSWLSQYYTPEKTTSPSTEASVVAELTGPSANVGKFDLTSLPSAKYKAVDSIGSGGMKVVRRVLDKDTTRTVAMATIRAELEDGEMVARFIREARITAILEHPNIVPVHDLGTDAAGRPYFTMKMLEGESLQEILKKLHADAPGYALRYHLGSLLDIFKKVCNAIAFAHSRGVVHLDLKPSNIHVSKFGEVLVLDWGLAKYVEEATESSSGGSVGGIGGNLNGLTLPGAVKGTLGFMAPEQARGENSRKDKRTDIYALGAILYAILTLKAPPSSDTVDRVLADTVAGNIVPPRKRAPGRDIPVALEAVAMKALSLDPNMRYQSVEELSRDVDAFLGGYATSAQDVNMLTILWLLVKRHKIRVALSVLVLLLIAGITAVSMVRIKASERTAVEALGKYRAEQEENRRLGIDAAPQVLRRAEKYMRELKIDDAMRELELAVTLDNSLADAWLGKGFLQLARQDFAGAAESFRRAPVPRRPVPKPERRKERETGPTVAQSKAKTERWSTEPEVLVEKYLYMTDAGRRSLTGREFVGFASNFVQVLSKTAPDVRLASTFLVFSFWNQKHGGEIEAREVGGALMKVLNPKAEDPAFELSKETGGLKLVVRGGRNLSNIWPLAGMGLVWLDLAGTGVGDIGSLHGMPLAYLDISGTAVRDLSPLVDAPLKELRVEGCKGLDFGQVARLSRLERIVISRDTVDAKQDASFKRNPGLDVVYR